MCLCFFAYKDHPVYDFILILNRDEFYARQTAPADFWKENPNILAGRDLEQQGTWLGVSQTKKFGFLTNYRDPQAKKEQARSRGDLVKDYLISDLSAETYLKKILPESNAYNGFNLVLGNQEKLYYSSNQVPEIRLLTPGSYGLSNHLLETPWPKVLVGKTKFEAILKTQKDFQEALFSMMLDETQADDKVLPNTGVGLEFERLLSPIFVKSPQYGTRSTTLLLRTPNGKLELIERYYQPGTQNYSEKKFTLD